MAEAIGLASGLLALITFTLKSSLTLSETVKSFQSHPKRIRDLVDELEALAAVLSSLKEPVNAGNDADFTCLELPLLRCGKACNEFREELLKCSSRSSSERTSFRDWAKLRYMGDDVDTFRRLLSGYKITICIALTDANLRTSTATAEDVASYSELLETARVDLNDRLESIDEKLKHIFEQNAATTEPESAEMRRIKEERLSTERCLQICSQLSDHISAIQLASSRPQPDGHVFEHQSSAADQITKNGLEECKISLARTAEKLKENERQLFHRLIEKSETVIASDQERMDLTRLRDELEATRQGIEICTRADEHLKDNVSTIDNYATGDAMQFMVSTSQKTIHGKNRGVGWRTRQVGGHISDSSLQEIARTFANVTIPMPASESTRNETGDKPGSKFEEQYGEGFKLTSR